jgi:hypothetical protein
VQSRRGSIPLSTKRGERGASATAVGVAVACALLVLVLVLRYSGDRSARADVEPVAPAASEATSGTSAHEIEVPPRTDDGAPRAAQSSLAGPQASRYGFDGKGVIRGEVVVAPGTVFPERWTLVIEPHPFLEGRERAVRREVEFTLGERTFEVSDLPLAGYRVRGEARGLNNVAGDVLLVRGSDQQYVTMLFAPAGFVDGSVLTADGAPAEALDVTLESKATRERRTVSTDAAGSYRIDDVVDGSYRLTFGTLRAPLLPVDSLTFKAPSMRFLERRLPPTGSVKLRTLDLAGAPIADVHVYSEAEPRGGFDLRTDRFANAHARHLWPGRYRIEAETEDGRKADVALDVAAGDELSIEIRLQP